MKTNDCVFRIHLIGERSVGKSSMLFRYTTKNFSNTFKPPIGMNFHTINLSINAKTLNLQIWDAEGEDLYHKVFNHQYYQKASGIILIYDITNRESFTNLDFWIDQFEYYSFNCVKLLVGNKLDLLHDRQVETAEGKELADKLGMGFIETSSKDNLGVDEAFEYLASKILDMVNAGKVDDVKGKHCCLF